MTELYVQESESIVLEEVVRKAWRYFVGGFAEPEEFEQVAQKATSVHALKRCKGMLPDKHGRF